MSDIDCYQTQVDECRRLLGNTDDLLARQVHEAMLQECQGRLAKAAWAPGADLGVKMPTTKPFATA